MDHTGIIRDIFGGQTVEVRIHQDGYEVLLEAGGRMTGGIMASLDGVGLRIMSVDVSGDRLRIMMRGIFYPAGWPDHKVWYSRSSGGKGRFLLEM